MSESFLADDPFLFLVGEYVPAGQIVQIFLDDDIAAAGKGRVLLADDGRSIAAGPPGFPSRDETDQVSIVEIFETVHFVRDGDCTAEAGHDLRASSKQIHAGGADVEEEVARGGDGMVLAVELPEWVEVLRPRRAEKPVPGVGTEGHHARQPSSRSRKPTARTRPPRSAQKERTVEAGASPELTVATRKIAARVSLREDRLLDRGGHARLRVDVADGLGRGRTSRKSVDLRLFPGRRPMQGLARLLSCIISATGDSVIAGEVSDVQVVASRMNARKKS